MTSTVTDRLVGVVGDFAYKAPCRAAAVAPITASGTQTIDGVALAILDRVLVTAQSDSTLNGIYTVDSGPWELAPDFLSSQSVARGSQVFVTDGSTNANTIWHIVATNPVNPQAPTSPPSITITKLTIGGGSGATGATGATGAAGATGTIGPTGATGSAAGAALLASLNAFTKSQTGPPGTLTDAATITWAGDTVQIATLTIAGNRTLAAITSPVIGTYLLIVTQGSGGTHTLAYNAAYKNPGGVAPTLSTAAGAKDALCIVYDGTDLLIIGIQKAFA